MKFDKEINWEIVRKKLLESLMETERKQNELTINNKYITWLDKFTQEHPSFSDEDWLYHPDEISEQDLKNVEILPYMYGVIMEYAEKHNIEANPCCFGNYYNIKYNNIGYEIGVMHGQGAINFCKRVSLDEEINEDRFIDFEDIINEQNKISSEILNKNKEKSEQKKYKVLFYRDGKSYYFYDCNKEESSQVSAITMNRLKERLTLPFDVEFSGLSRAQMGRIVNSLLQDMMNVEIIKIISPKSNVLKFEAKFTKKEFKVSVFEVSGTSLLYSRSNNNNPFKYIEINGKKVLMEVAKDDILDDLEKYYFLAEDLTSEERTFFDIVQKDIVCDYIYRLDNELKINNQGKNRVRRITKRLGN